MALLTLLLSLLERVVHDALLALNQFLGFPQALQLLLHLLHLLLGDPGAGKLLQHPIDFGQGVAGLVARACLGEVPDAVQHVHQVLAAHRLPIRIHRFVLLVLLRFRHFLQEAVEGFLQFLDQPGDLLRRRIARHRFRQPLPRLTERALRGGEAVVLKPERGFPHQVAGEFVGAGVQVDQDARADQGERRHDCQIVIVGFGRREERRDRRADRRPHERLPVQVAPGGYERAGDRMREGPFRQREPERRALADLVDRIPGAERQLDRAARPSMRRQVPEDRALRRFRARRQRRRQGVRLPIAAGRFAIRRRHRDIGQDDAVIVGDDIVEAQHARFR